MALTIGVQMDPIANIDIAGDTTFALALEAQNRGHSLFVYEIDNMSSDAHTIWAHGNQVRVKDDIGNHVEIGKPERRDLASCDVILMRQDPPFDMAYITATHLLERLPASTMVINNPAEVRNAPEKILVTLFPDIMPPTLISRNMQDIKAFRDTHKDIIIKPLYGNGGAAVFRLQPEDQNLSALLEVFFAQSREPVIAQRYLPEIMNGDKRIILIDGQAVGAINRMPQQGEARSNLHVGGTAQPTELSPQDQKICDQIGDELRRRGLLFVGIDVIGDYITEINVTSPTGIREMSRFTGKNIAGLFWDCVEAKHPDHAGNTILSG